MAILLTGASGFIGGFVAELLTEQNLEVTCLVRKTSSRRWLEGLSLNFFVGSLSVPASYESVLNKCDYVIHLAGVTKTLNRDEFYQGNVLNTKNLLDSIVKLKRPIKRFLLVSSQAAVGSSPTRQAIDETHPCHPITSYGRSKYESERVVAEYRDKVPITILRPPAVYGPRDRDVLNLFKSIKLGINLMVGKTDQLVSIVYVKDLARGIVQATFSENSVGKTYFICEEKAYHWSHVVKLIADQMNKKFITIKLPLPVARLIAFFMEMSAKITRGKTILNREKMLEINEPYWVISPHKARQDFNYSTQYPLYQGIENTLKWYQEKNWI
jgi:nucleoside-diphosphate-sugar epimerase